MAIVVAAVAVFWLICAVIAQGYLLSETQRGIWGVWPKATKEQYKNHLFDAWVFAALGPLALAYVLSSGGFRWGLGLKTGWQLVGGANVGGNFPTGPRVTHYFLDKWLTACTSEGGQNHPVDNPPTLEGGYCADCVDALRRCPQVAIEELLRA